MFLSSYFIFNRVDLYQCWTKRISGINRYLFYGSRYFTECACVLKRLLIEMNIFHSSRVVENFSTFCEKGSRVKSQYITLKVLKLFSANNIQKLNNVIMLLGCLATKSMVTSLSGLIILGILPWVSCLLTLGIYWLDDVITILSCSATKKSQSF